MSWEFKTRNSIALYCIPDDRPHKQTKQPNNLLFWGLAFYVSLNVIRDKYMKLFCRSQLSAAVMSAVSLAYLLHWASRPPPCRSAWQSSRRAAWWLSLISTKVEIFDDQQKWFLRNFEETFKTSKSKATLGNCISPIQGFSSATFLVVIRRNIFFTKT